MQIESLYVYPIKSLRAQSLEEAQLTKHGFRYDRRFMLLEVQHGEDGNISYKNMHLSHYSEMVLFFTQLQLDAAAAAAAAEAQHGKIVVTYKPPEGPQSSIDIPVEPSTGNLAPMTVNMHNSPTAAWKMDDRYNKWFSERFGYEVVLAYLGDQYRSVLMSTTHQVTTQSTPGWFSSISTAATSLLGGAATSQSEEITFADCAPYLIVSERSMDDVHTRLPDGQIMDITKFRPNVIVSGAAEPWEEDYWAQITINKSTKIECIHNCARCQSINIDYATGKPGTSEAGKMLAKLQKDRRIDAGAKYSPVFGRYSFLNKDSENDVIRVGDQVSVTRTNQDRTRFGELLVSINDVQY